ncbi:MAG: PspC domain-containing protein [candidate division Zixibacteria bacterium]|nr:PspC domain-containing protein [candidate division Zixibacteria bacterium]MDH3937707.1 PspC domain-containing protein [candidate division Zixibacteria bacterium]MDH4034712.1 PspC domain-containing protein [candidate division Zixibacteria bacterium]
MEKRLYRSETNKVISGVCGGLGEYFEVDPVLVRVVTVILTLATGVAIFAYIAAWIIVPSREGQAESETPVASEPKSDTSWRKYLPGLVLIGIGAVLLIRESFYWFDWSEFWPVLMILAGLALIFRRGRKSDTQPAANNGSAQPSNGGPIT